MYDSCVIFYTPFYYNSLMCVCFYRRATDPLTWSYVEKAQKGVQGNSVSQKEKLWWVEAG